MFTRLGLDGWFLSVRVEFDRFKSNLVGSSRIQPVLVGSSRIRSVLVGSRRIRPVQIEFNRFWSVLVEFDRFEPTGSTPRGRTDQSFPARPSSFVSLRANNVRRRACVRACKHDNLDLDHLAQRRNKPLPPPQQPNHQLSKHITIRRVSVGLTPPNSRTKKISNDSRGRASDDR